jgi:glycosyltransferase involved in cell wall biosynthesis
MYRLAWAAQAMAGRGMDVTVAEPKASPLMVKVLRYASGERLAELIEPPDCDALVLQRTMDWRFPWVIPQLQDAGIRVVIDIDDDLYALKPNHIGWAAIQPANNRDMNIHHLRISLSLADVVTVSAPALAERYGDGRARVLPNCVPERYLAIERAEPHEGIWVGWPGATGTHPGDLDSIRGVVPALLRSQPTATFHALGNPDGVRRALGMSYEPVHHPRVDIAQYPQELASLDIGICPLQGNEFNRSKSWLKPLEMAAVGVVPVVSAMPEYERAGAEGFAIVAKNRRQWEANLWRLADDHLYRSAMAAEFRQAAARWTIEGRLNQWIEAWTGAIDPS